MSKFVLCAANCVKIASCHCGFGTVLTLTVTFGRVLRVLLAQLLESLRGRPLEPQERERHRIIGQLARGVRRGLRGPAPAVIAAAGDERERRGSRDDRCRDLESPLHALLLQRVGPALDSRRHLATLHPAARNLRCSCIDCQHLTVLLHFLSSAALGSRHGDRHRATAAFACFDPADGSVIESLQSARPEDGIAAVDAAEAAAADWAARAPRERAEILRRAFDLMTARNDEIAHLIVREMGKPLRRGARRDRLRRRVPALVLRGGGARERRLRHRSERHQPDARHACADRHLAADHALELPGRDGHAQDRAGAGRGLHGCAQAGRRRRR